MEKDKDIGALWSRSKDGKEYMTGVVTIDNVAHQIVIFKNSYKTADNQPDWRIYPSKPKSAVEEEAPPVGTGHAPQIEEPESQIPF